MINNPFIETIIKPFQDLLQDERPLDLVRLRQLFLLHAQTHYSNSEHYGIYADALKDLVYDPGTPEKSKLTVALAHTFGPKTAFGRPAVYVRIRGAKFGVGAIANNAGTSFDGSTRYNYHPTTATFSLVCIHPDADIATMLAETGLTFFEGARMAIMTRFGLQAMDVVSLGEPEFENKHPENYFQVDLVYSLKFALVTETLTEGHRIKKIGVSVAPESA